jgi:tetratricopeptide (TPR) repeat protein
VRWNAESSRAHFNLGLAHRALGKPTLALRALRRAAKAQDVEAEARYVIAQILAAQGRRRAARLECDKALALKPDLAALKALREDLQ